MTVLAILPSSCLFINRTLQFQSLAFDQGPKFVGQAFQDIGIGQPAVAFLAPFCSPVPPRIEPRLPEQRQVIAEREQAVAGMPGHLFQESEALEIGDHPGGGGKAEFQVIGRLGDRHHGMRKKKKQELLRHFRFSAHGHDFLLIGFAQLDDGGQGLLAAPGRGRNPGQEEFYPLVQVIGTANHAERIVIGSLVPFEKIGQVQRRLLQEFQVDQLQGDQQPANAAIAVQERMDGFKLVVTDGDLDQFGNDQFPVVPVFFQVG